MKESLDKPHLWFVSVPCQVYGTYCFSGSQRSFGVRNSQIVGRYKNNISRRGAWTNLICICNIFGTFITTIFVEVQCHFGSKPCKHRIKFHIGLLVYHTEYIHATDFGVGQRSFNTPANKNIDYEIIKTMLHL